MIIITHGYEYFDFDFVDLDLDVDYFGSDFEDSIDNIANEIEDIYDEYL